jgi:dTDP-4-dehydrorhamnose 3,5-epimerase-like enzyme
MKIIGLRLINRNIFSNNKGRICKFVNKKDFFFKKFGEVYFNYTKKKKRKGWILHKKTNCIIALIYGELFFHFIDSRKIKKTFNNEAKFNLNEKRFKILFIPKGVWFSFFAKKDSCFINLIENIHSDKEVLRSEKVKEYLIKN